MAGAKITLDTNAPEIAARLNRLAARLGDLTPAFRSMGEYLLKSTDERFDSQTAPDGRSWAPLSDDYKARKAKHADKILQLEGYLRDSFRYQADPYSVIVGTNAVYAAVHQFGAKMGEFGRYYQLTRLQYDTKDFRRYAGMHQGHPIPWGDIPARPMLGLSAEDEKELLDIIGDFLEA